MKRVTDKEFDDLFHNKLKDAEFNSGDFEDDWSNLELMMDKPKKPRGIVFWLPVLSSAAAILVFLGLWLFRADVAPAVKPKQQVAANLSNQTGNAVKSQQQITVQQQSIASTNINKVEQAAAHGKTATALVADNSRKAAASIKQVNQTSVQSNTVNQKQSLQNIDNGINTTNTVQLTSNREPNNFQASDAVLTLNTDNKAFIAENIEAKSIIQKGAVTPAVIAKQKADSKVTSSVFAKHPQFALTVLGAPEVNGVGSFGDAKGGTNIGLLFSAGIFNKITISTGANYAVMPYNTNIANYHTNYTFKTDPSQIEADCRALDIPINIDYQLYNKHQNKFSIGTGLSSYIMLHESYNYTYTDPTTKGPVAYTVPNHGQYFFGVANLQATYTRQVNSKFGLSIQPYLKLPLTNIGYSQAKLQTAGVAVGLSWNINSLTKP